MPRRYLEPQRPLTAQDERRRSRAGRAELHLSCRVPQDKHSLPSNHTGGSGEGQGLELRLLKQGHIVSPMSPGSVTCSAQAGELALFAQQEFDLQHPHQKPGIRAGETAQQVRPLAAFAEDLGLIPTPMLYSLQLPVTPDPGELMPSSGLRGH